VIETLQPEILHGAGNAYPVVGPYIGALITPRFIKNLIIGDGYKNRYKPAEDERGEIVIAMPILLLFIG